jgi:hypothetical protein
VGRTARIAIAVSLAGAVALSAQTAGASSRSLKRVSPPGRGYTVELPSTWRFANASYPSDHATHLWFDPQNALRRLLVVLSGCAGCAQQEGARAGVPAGASGVERLTGSTDAFQDFTDDDPWIANGISIVAREHGEIDGYVTVEVWLPPDQHALATTILDSFRLARASHG